MCGRYAIQRNAAALADQFGAVDRTGGAVAADYNVTPTKTVPIIVERFATGGTERSVRLVRWGLVPSWAKDLDSGPSMINARAESITTKIAYAESVARRRCLMPATGWYEWKPGNRRRQPFLCSRADGAELAMAAIFSAWWSSKRTREPLVTCAVVTTAALGELAEIHHRMPLVLPRDRWSEWLDPGRTEVTGLLDRPGQALDDLTLRSVSTEVNSIRNSRPELLERVEPASELAEQVALFES